ncbi:hypothetical protein JG687_00014912 [Phytophthora cactorum]|uniref:Uncharacterized protein n=1 Tax=Phytophthora cactorum TaxID=29920 RepID=A0A8T1TYD8_9STRA|nr:hypothetical protein JG687_00014912 [Phytophthora cactorum]
MEAPRRQNHYIVKQRWEALNIPLGTLKGGEKSQRCCSSTRGPRRAELQRVRARKARSHLDTNYLTTSSRRTSRGSVFVYWRHDRVHADGAGSLARDVFSEQVIS